jgi:hypothetical protein
MNQSQYCLCSWCTSKTERVSDTWNVFSPLKSVAWVRESTIPTERPPLVYEVSANFCGKRGVAWSVQRIPYCHNLSFLDWKLSCHCEIWVLFVKEDFFLSDTNGSSCLFSSLWLPPNRCIGQDLQPDNGAVSMQGRSDRSDVQPVCQGLPAEPLPHCPLHKYVCMTLTEQYNLSIGNLDTSQIDIG